MPPVVKIDRARKLVCFTFHGVVQPDQVLQQSSLVAADPDFSPAFAEIVDLTNAIVADVSLTLAAALLANTRRFGRSARHIIVIVAPPDLLFVLAHRFQQLGAESSPHLLMACTMEEARKLAARPQRRFTDVS